ncbi:MAG: ribonuclease H family protein [Eubacterium sp.]|nr:ribonuclease H family protein [Eubacterium sp.]
MAEKKNYYAVRKGITPGIYKTWPECQKNVMGFPGAIYKGFKTLEEAQAFMDADKDPWWADEKYRNKARDKASESKDGSSGNDKERMVDIQETIVMAPNLDQMDQDIFIIPNLDQMDQDIFMVRRYTTNELGQAPAGLKRFMEDMRLSDAVAFVDGSYNIVTEEYGYGMLIYHDGILYEEAAGYNNKEMCQMRNVSGEIEGSMKAMQYCIDHGIETLDIYYDYEGIEKWALGYWKTNKAGTIAYKKYYDGIKNRLSVNFVKVKGHSGDMGNERADYLAKLGADVN